MPKQITCIIPFSFTSLLIYLSLSPRRLLSLHPPTLPRYETAIEFHHRAPRVAPAPRPPTNLSSLTTDKSHLLDGRQFPLSHMLTILGANSRRNQLPAQSPPINPRSALQKPASPHSTHIPPTTPLQMHNSLYSRATSIPSHSLDATPTHRKVLWSHPYYCP